MIIMVIQCGCLDMIWAEDRKLYSQLEWLKILNPAHVPYWWVNNPTLGEFCFTIMIKNSGELIVLAQPLVFIYDLIH